MVWRAALYRCLITARIKAQWQYRTSLAIDAVAAFFLTFVDFIVILALFKHFEHLAGWSLAEVAFIYGIAGTGFALCDLAIGHIENIGDEIRSGRFDTMLLRPAGTLLQVVASDFPLRRVGKILQAAGVLVYAVTQLSIQWTVLKVLLLGLSIASGAAVFAAIFILGASLQFAVMGTAEIANAFTYGGNQFASYPVDIYGPWLKRIFAYAIPLGFVAYFPSQYIIGKGSAPLLVQVIGPLVAAVFLSFAVGVWTFAVRHYRSTGS